MKCENCGKEIDKIITNFFDIDGSDYEQEIFIEEYDDIVYFDFDRNWCYYELSENEQHEGIRCPYCGKPPFKKHETDIYIKVIKCKDIDNTNKMGNYDKWKENPTSEYKIDQNVVKDIIIPPPYIKEDHYYIPPENIFLKIKNFLCYGFYPFKNLSIDEFVDIMMPNMCSEDCPVIRVCKENNEEINEENTEKACKVCKNAFKEFLLEV